MLKKNLSILSLNTGGNLHPNDMAEKIANDRNASDASELRKLQERPQTTDTTDMSDTDDSESGSRNPSPNARDRLGMNGRRPRSRQVVR